MRFATYLPLPTEQKEWLDTFVPDWKYAEETIEKPGISKNVRVTKTTFYIDIPDEKSSLLFALRWS